MANSFEIEHCYLDTFGDIIDFKDQFPAGFRVISIEWTRPTLTGHTCLIRREGPASPYLVEWECAIVGERRINFYEGRHYENLYIDADAIQSGKILIVGK